MSRLRVAAAAVLLMFIGLLASPGAARGADSPDDELIRLTAVLSELDTNPALADKAPLERFKARQALAALQTARSRDRGHALLLANAWVEAARAAAQAEVLIQQSAQLDRERDQIMLEASRRDAELARREADRLRLQSLAREEEEQRLAESVEMNRVAAEQSAASAEATNAKATQTLKLANARARETELAKREALLAAAVANDQTDAAPDTTPAPATTATATAIVSRQVGNRRIHTLPGTAFASGSAALTAAATASLRQLAGAIGGGHTVRIEAHTDSQGSDAANLALSARRAEAVRKVLAAAGVPSARLSAVGRGEVDPLVDNGTAAGRARNRRVEIIVE